MHYAHIRCAHFFGERLKMKPLRVGIDLTGIWRRPTGIFRYSAEMAKHLLLLPEIEGRGDSCSRPAIDYVLFFAREVHPDFVPLQHTFEAFICPTSNELLCKQLWFPAILPRLHLDIMHYPAFPPPYVGLFSPPTVMTFYDAGPWRYPQAQTLHGRLYFRALLSRGVRTCAQVTTLSTHARSEIGRILGERYLPKISVAPGAGRAEFGAAVSETEKHMVRTRYHLPDSYFLAVATIEPRKNLPTLLDAYVRLRQACGGTCPELVIVGRKGWNCDDILQYMASLEGSVHFLGHIPDQDLIAVYQMALCLVFPSLYEGFGLPIIEAMTAGCPVIAADSSSLPEVAGDAALLVDALDAEKIALAMRCVWQDEALRQRMIADGRIQASRFSWEETARITREVYLQVAQTPV
jgi:glycosyltransferase involved in cell wall biosynthesis